MNLATHTRLAAQNKFDVSDPSGESLCTIKTGSRPYKLYHPGRAHKRSYAYLYIPALLLFFHWIPHGHHLIYAMGSMCGSRIAEKGRRPVRYGTSSFPLASKTLKLTDTLGLRELHSGSLSVKSPEPGVLSTITCTSAPQAVKDHDRVTTDLHSTMRQVRFIVYRHTVDMHRPALDPFGHVQTLLVIFSPYARTESDVRVVRDPDSILDILGPDDDERGTERLLVVNVLGRVYTVEDDGSVGDLVVFRRDRDALDQVGALSIGPAKICQYSRRTVSAGFIHTLDVASATRLCNLSTPALLAIRILSRPLNSAVRWVRVQHHSPQDH